MRTFAAAKDVSGLRKQLESRGTAWVAAVGAGAPVEARRRLVAATMALELANARLEDEWEELRSLIEWGCQLVSAGAPGETEHLWQLAALAGSEGALDAGVLFKLSGPIKSWGHLAHAKARFPHEPRLVLAERFAARSGFNSQPSLGAGMEPDVDGPPSESSPNKGLLSQSVGTQREYLASIEAARREKAHTQMLRDSAVKQLRELSNDPIVGAEAALRAGHIQLISLQLEPALESVRVAARQSTTPYATYLAHFFRGRILERLNRPEEAERAYAAAADAIPRAQSAVLARSALLMRAGRTTEAHELTRASFDAKRRPPDPWRLFPYGDYYRWPELIAQLRKALAR